MFFNFYFFVKYFTGFLLLYSKYNSNDLAELEPATISIAVANRFANLNGFLTVSTTYKKHL